MRNVQIGAACRFLERPSSSSSSSPWPSSSLSPSREPHPPLLLYLFSFYRLWVRPCRRLASVLVNGKHFRIGTPSLHNLPPPPPPFSNSRSERTGGPLSPCTVIQRRGRARHAVGSCARIDQAPLFRSYDDASVGYLSMGSPGIRAIRQIRPYRFARSRCLPGVYGEYVPV